MRERSFHDIFLEKLEGLKPQTVSEPSLDFLKFALHQPLPFIEKAKPKPPPPPPTSFHRESVAVPLKKKEPLAPPVVEKWIYKKDLSEQGQQAWEKFEKMLGISFHGQTSKRLAMASFRRFIRSVHPDTSRLSGSHDFSNYVEIKDALMKHFK